MAASRIFPALSDAMLSEHSKTLLAEQKKKHGFVAAPLARAAASPATLGAVLSLLERFERASLEPAEREVLAFIVGYANGCEYCMALHTALARHVEGVSPHIETLRGGKRPDDVRLGAFWDFVRAVLEMRGAASDAALEAFLAAGYTPENALDVVLGVGTYTLTTFANRLVRAPLDPPLAGHRWEK